jgi:hypothetical protein
MAIDYSEHPHPLLQHPQPSTAQSDVQIHVPSSGFASREIAVFPPGALDPYLAPPLRTSPTACFVAYTVVVGGGVHIRTTRLRKPAGSPIRWNLAELPEIL